MFNVFCFAWSEELLHDANLLSKTAAWAVVFC